MNRFFDSRGDVSRQLAPWTSEVKLQRKAMFELVQPIRFHSDRAGGVIRVEVDFLSDLASIPRFAWSIFLAPDDPRIELGGWVHDLLYQRKGAIVLESGRITNLSRKDCDYILAYEAMAELGAGALKQWVVYWALRIFGDRWH